MRLAEYRTDDTGVVLVAAFPVDTFRLSNVKLMDFAQRRLMIVPLPTAQRD